MLDAGLAATMKMATLALHGTLRGVTPMKSKLRAALAAAGYALVALSVSAVSHSYAQSTPSQKAARPKFVAHQKPTGLLCLSRRNQFADRLSVL